MIQPDLSAPAYDQFANYDVVAHEVEYRRDAGRSYQARIYQPQGAGAFPALVEVHGGAWMMGPHAADEALDRKIAASGVVVAAVDFRLSGEAPYPASMTDINYATRWFKAHALEYNASPRGPGGIGYSSGGHMVMLSAMRAKDPRYASLPLHEDPDVDASLAYVIAGWPVLDPSSRYHYAATINRPELVQAALSYFIDEAGMSEANPQHILDRGEAVQLPPTLILHGAADAQVTPRTVETFVESYAAAGGVIELAKYPGEPHGFMRDDTDNTRRALGLLKSFIARQLAG